MSAHLRTLSLVLVLFGTGACAAASVDDAGVTEADLQGGRLDRTFGVDGTLRIAFADDARPASDIVDALTELPDGRVVVAGVRSEWMYQDRADTLGVARFLANGNPDPTFGNSGRVVTRVAVKQGGAYTKVNAVAGTPDGKLVVLATQRVELAEEGGVVVLRYLADGTLDPTFGTAGVVRTNLGFTNLGAMGLDLVVQPDGRLVVFGRGQSFLNGGGRARAVRLAQDGSVDATFAPELPMNDVIEGHVSATPDGHFFAGAGRTLVRFDSDGKKDPAFAQAALPDGAYLTALAATTDGGAFLAGIAKPADATDLNKHAFFVARYAADGKLVASYGDAGVRAIELAKSASVKAVLPIAQGRVVVVGDLLDWSAPGVPRSLYMARLDAAGTLDASWGQTGVVEQPLIGEIVDAPFAAISTRAVKADRILVAGATGTTSNRDGLVRRYLP